MTGFSIANTFKGLCYPLRTNWLVAHFLLNDILDPDLNPSITKDTVHIHSVAISEFPNKLTGN